MGHLKGVLIICIKVQTKEAEELFQDFFDWRMRRSPEFSTFIGLKDYNDVLEEFTEERFQEDLTSCQGRCSLLVRYLKLKF